MDLLPLNLHRCCKREHTCIAGRNVGHAHSRATSTHRLPTKPPQATSARDHKLSERVLLRKGVACALGNDVTLLRKTHNCHCEVAMWAEGARGTRNAESASNAPPLHTFPKIIAINRTTADEPELAATLAGTTSSTASRRRAQARRCPKRAKEAKMERGALSQRAASPHPTPRAPRGPLCALRARSFRPARARATKDAELPAMPPRPHRRFDTTRSDADRNRSRVLARATQRPSSLPSYVARISASSCAEVCDRGFANSSR